MSTADSLPSERPGPGARHAGPSVDGPVQAPAGLASTLLAGGLLIVFILAAYAPIVRAGFIWDDEAYVTGNPTLRTFRGLGQMWFVPSSLPQYYPLVHTTYWVEYHLWGLDPAGYHVVNVLLHATAAILFWRVLLRLRLPGAWIAAALFAVHPVAVESVAWVTERKNVLSLVFALASLLCYLRFSPADADESRNESRSASNRWRWYVWALAFFVAALFSKTVVASLPAVILVIYWWKRGRITVANVLPLLPFFVLGIASGLYTVWLERTHVGASGARFAFTPVDRILMAGHALWFYAGKLVYPYPLAFFYPRWKIEEHSWSAFLYPAAFVALLIILWVTRTRIGRGPLAAALIFAGVLFPALGFFNVYPFRYSLVADHFQYHASLALLALTAAACVWASRLLAGSLLDAEKVLFAGVLLLLGVLTYQRTFTFQGVEPLYRDTLAKNPESVISYANLGLHLGLVGRFDEALALERKALELDPDEPAAHADLAMVLLSIGAKNGFQPGQLDEAAAHLNRCLELSPDYLSAHHNLAYVKIAKGRPDEALRLFQRILELSPRDGRALFGIGSILVAQHRNAEAEDYLQRAADSEPELMPCRLALGKILLDSGRIKEAVPHLQAAVRLDPDSADAQFALSEALMQVGDVRGAANHFMATRQLRPIDQQAIVKLGVALLNLRDFDNAIECFEDALRQNPQNFNARFGLANVLIQQDKIPAAIEQLGKVIEAYPAHVEAHYSLGSLQLAGGDAKAALPYLTEAVRLRPNFFEGLFALGTAELASGNITSARQHLSEALKIRPDDSQARAKLAEAQRASLAPDQPIPPEPAPPDKE